jgi:hypothetical protein
VHRRSIRQPSPERDPHRLKGIFVSAAEKVAGKVDWVKGRVTQSGNARYSGRESRWQVAEKISRKKPTANRYRLTKVVPRSRSVLLGMGDFFVLKEVRLLRKAELLNKG